MRAFIVGCGRIAGGYNRDDRSRVLTHVVAYRHFGVQVVGCCDVDAAAARRFAEEWSIEHSGTELEALLRQTAPDIVSDCTPPAGRLAVVETSRQQPSVRAMVIEKPLGETGADARAVAGALAASGIRAVVNYFRAFDPFYRGLAGEVRRAPRGRLVAASSLYYGSALTNASHLMERILAMMGAPTAARRLGGSDEAPLFELSFEDDAIATFIPAPAVTYSPLEMDLFFERGRTRVLDGEHRVERFDRVPDPLFPGYWTLTPAPQDGPILAPEVEAFASVFQHMTRPDDGASAGIIDRAVLVTELLEQIR